MEVVVTVSKCEVDFLNLALPLAERRISLRWRASARSMKLLCQAEYWLAEGERR